HSPVTHPSYTSPPPSSYLYFFFLMIPPPPRSTLFPYTTLFRSSDTAALRIWPASSNFSESGNRRVTPYIFFRNKMYSVTRRLPRSEEHTSELQSLRHLVCRLLLEKKKKKKIIKKSIIVKKIIMS